MLPYALVSTSYVPCLCVSLHWAAGWVPVLVTFLYVFVWLQASCTGSVAFSQRVAAPCPAMPLAMSCRHPYLPGLACCHTMQVADVAKVVIQRVFRRYEKIKVCFAVPPPLPVAAAQCLRLVPLLDYAYSPCVVRPANKVRYRPSTKEAWKGSAAAAAVLCAALLLQAAEYACCLLVCLSRTSATRGASSLPPGCAG